MPLNVMRREREDFFIGGGTIRITVLDLTANRVTLAVDAPRDIDIQRGEIHRSKECEGIKQAYEEGKIKLEDVLDEMHKHCPHGIPRKEQHSLFEHITGQILKTVAPSYSSRQSKADQSVQHRPEADGSE